MSVRVTPFEVGLKRPLSTARGDIETRRGFLVRGVVDGVSGLGEATPLPGWTESYDDCRRALELVDDLGAALSTDVLDDAPAARHAVALALFDARARAQGDSLARFLVGDRSTVGSSVPVNATVGDASVRETEKAVREAVDTGYDCVKLKVGVGSVDGDVDRLQAAREAAPSVDLRADANGAWTPAKARAFLDRLPESVALDYLEQPLDAEAVTATAALRAETDVPIALDESLAAYGVGEILAAEAADTLVLKPMALGGPARTLGVAERAAEAGVDSVVTTTIDAVVARTGALHVAAALGTPPACGLATGGLLTDDVATDPAPVEEGSMTCPAGPGLAGDAFDSVGSDTD